MDISSLVVLLTPTVRSARRYEHVMAWEGKSELPGANNPMLFRLAQDMSGIRPS
jgi:hypothetical protein